jgi:type IV fimbrial biogenesis protein FimT
MKPTEAPLRFYRGFTLTELVVTTGLLAVLIQIGVPSLTKLLASWQRDAATKAITSHLALARSEAIHWSRRVVMCSSEDGLQCAAASSKDWQYGWLIFQDLDDNNQFGSGDKLVAVGQKTHGIKSLSGNASVQRFVFLPTGLMASGMGTLEVTPREGKIQRITVNRIGRVRLSMTEPQKPSS